jgi:hypothetical protein
MTGTFALMESKSSVQSAKLLCKAPQPLNFSASLSSASTILYNAKMADLKTKPDDEIPVDL